LIFAQTELNFNHIQYYQIYSYFIQICPNFAKIGLNFAQIYLKKFGLVKTLLLHVLVLSHLFIYIIKKYKAVKTFSSYFTMTSQFPPLSRCCVLGKGALRQFAQHGIAINKQQILGRSQKINRKSWKSATPKRARIRSKYSATIALL